MTPNGVIKSRDVTKNFNENLRICIPFKVLNGFSTLLYLAVSNLIHAGIPLPLF